MPSFNFRKDVVITWYQVRGVCQAVRNFPLSKLFQQSICRGSRIEVSIVTQKNNSLCELLQQQKQPHMVIFNTLLKNFQGFTINISCYCCQFSEIKPAKFPCWHKTPQQSFSSQTLFVLTFVVCLKTGCLYFIRSKLAVITRYRMWFQK